MFALSVPTVWVRDSIVSAPALMTVPFPVLASVVTNARFAAIAAPMLSPVAGPVVTALPLAFAVESVLPFAESVRPAAPALMKRPAGSAVLCETTLIVTASAAATCSGLLFPEPSFSELSAFGVAGAPPTVEPAPTSPAFF